MDFSPDTIPDLPSLPPQQLLQLFGAVYEASVIAKDANGSDRYEKNMLKVRHEIVQRFTDADAYETAPETPLDDGTTDPVVSMTAAKLLERSQKMHLVAARTRGHKVASYYQQRAETIDTELVRRLTQFS